MKSIWIRGELCLLIALTAMQATARAQLPTADLSRLQPRACRAGESTTITLSGKNLEDLSGLVFSHRGITAARVTLPADEFFPAPRHDGLKFSVEVAGDVPPGIYEVRAIGYFGVSTARPFVIAAADSKEIDETGDHSRREKAMAIEIGSVINGAVSARGIDWYKFDASAGRRLLADVHAERLDSRLDGLLVVYDDSGREVGRNREHFGRDPFLEINTGQTGGVYYLAVSDILYRGGADHFYRLRVSEHPHIDFLEPPAAIAGRTESFTLYGRNLPGGSLSKVKGFDGRLLESLVVEHQTPSADHFPTAFFAGQPRHGILPGFDYSLGSSNSVRIGFATAEVAREDSKSSLQAVTVPVEISGCFNRANDEDVFQFQAEKGKTYCVEAIADRMGIQVDTFLAVHRVSNDKDESSNERKLIAENDDMTSFFSVHGMDSINADTSDSSLKFVADESGLYSVTIINQFGGGGDWARYRLAIREPSPDFQLIATTEHPLPTNRTGYSVTPHLRQGARWGIRVLAPRQDGFEGDIVISAKGLPEGVTAEPLTLSGQTDRGVLVITASKAAPKWAGEIEIVGTAKASGAALVRKARFASLVWGHVFADSIRVRSRLTQSTPLSVNGFESAPVVFEAGQNEFQVEVGKTIEIPVKIIENGSRVGSMTVEPFGLYGLLRNPPKLDIAENETEGKLSFSFKPTGLFAVKPGRYQFTLKGVGVAKYRHNLRASELAAADQRRIEEAIAKLNASATSQQSAVGEIEKRLTSAKQQLQSATADAKVGLQAKLKQVQVELDAAKKLAKETAGRLGQANRAKTTADRLAQAAEKRAAESKEKFAAWSKLITVTVTEPKKPAK